MKKIINESESGKFKVKLEIKIQKSPIKRVKAIANPFDIEAFHVCDYESDDTVHREQFERTLKELKEARKIKGNISYKLGYSKFPFELWIILHEMPFLTSVVDPTKYLAGINQA